MKIAFVVTFFDFRNDVRRVIERVAKQHKVVVLGEAHQAATIMAHLPESVEFRAIDEKKKTIWNTFWEWCYLLFKKIPQSKDNFFLMQLFLAANAPNEPSRKKALRILSWVQALPKVLGYDTFLNRLRITRKTHLEDIDHFLLFTSIADDYLLARLIRERRTFDIYVYSWDHPCKNPKFTKRGRYVCWSEATKEDVVALQKIQPERVRVVGSSQFGYIHEYLSQKHILTPTYSFPYLYFGCAVGITELAKEEVAIIKQVHEVLVQSGSPLKLVVRPYPVMRDWSVYDELRLLPTIVMDDRFRTGDLSVSNQAILEKFEKIHFAKAFFHLGTTMGLEACFTDTPSFILDFGYTSTQGLSIYNFIHQYQNDRYLTQPEGSNHIRSLQALREVIQDLGHSRYLAANERVRERFQPLLSFDEFAERVFGGSGPA